MLKSLEDSGLLLKGVGEKIQNEGKKQKRGFLTSLLGDILAGKGMITAGEGFTSTGFGSSIKNKVF